MGANILNNRDLVPNQTYSLGPLTFYGYGPKNAQIRYIWVHGDESVARDMTLNLAQNKKRCFLVNSISRLVESNGIHINPNRVFSGIGAEENLRFHNPGITDDNLDQILRQFDRDRDNFFKLLWPRKDSLLVALHNNFESYTIAAEVKNAKATHLPEKDHFRDFYLTVNEKDFEKLATGPYNVVLQDENGLDDGSLSRAAQKMNVRYINLETNLHKPQRQKAMLDWLTNTWG